MEKSLDRNGSLALGNAALYEKLRRSEAELREWKKLSDSLGEIHLLIHSTLDMDRIINGVIAKGTEAIEAESAMVFFRSEGDIWEVKYVYRLPAELTGRKYDSEMVRHSVIAIEKNRPVAIDDVQSDDRVDRRFVDSLNIKSLLDFPLSAKEKILGDVVFHYHSKATSFTEAHVDFAGKLASSLALALENSLLFNELKNSEKALKESEKRLKLTVEEINRSNIELQQFVSIVSHDLQEPLRTVANFLELLAARYKGKLDEKADTYIAFAVEGAQRMSRLIYDLVAYSRVGTRAREFGQVALEEILKQVKDSFHRAIEESDAEISHDRLPEVEGDGTQLGQVLQNLLGNAIKFRQKAVPPRIHISAERRGDEWLFGVHDNGIGIDSRYRDRIFIIFQRLHSREEFAGTGVGLAICRKIVEMHQGRIWVESEPGEGSSFYFTLPARQGKAG